MSSTRICSPSATTQTVFGPLKSRQSGCWTRTVLPLSRISLKDLNGVCPRAPSMVIGFTEITLEEFLFVHVLVKIDRLFDEIADGSQHEKRGLKKIRRAIAEGIDEFIHIEIFRPAPKIQKAIFRGKINGSREED